MSDLDFPDDERAVRFARSFLKHYLAHGFQSLSKRDVDLLVFYELETCGVVEDRASNYDVARLLKVTPQRAKSLREHAYARWGEASPTEVLRRLLTRYFQPETLDAALAYGEPKWREQGYLPFLIEHPVERVEFERAVKDAGAIPIYERNREVLLVRFETVVAIALDQGLAPRDALKRVQAALRKAPSLQELLTTDIKKLSLADFRSAANKLAAKCIEGGLTSGLSALGAAVIK